MSKQYVKLVSEKNIDNQLEKRENTEQTHTITLTKPGPHIKL